MDFVTPSYYHTFKCIADRCTDNCCIGWEIAVDAPTAAFYRSVQGAFGQRLRNNISDDDCFLLQGERCPFLNEKKLCDIIIHCGEEHLCNICRDHPRYFEWFSDRKEGGLGLSCEEAARLILTTDTVQYTRDTVDEEPEDVDEPLFLQLLSARDAMFAITDADRLSVAEKLCAVLDLAEQVQADLDGAKLLSAKTVENARADFADIIPLFLSFEPIDRTWEETLQALLQGKTLPQTVLPRAEQYMCNLLRYFVWRYFLKAVFDEQVLPKIKFAVVSVLFILTMTDGCDSLATWIAKSKLYSKEMEYSDENTDLFYRFADDKPCLSAENIRQIIQNMK